MHGVQNQSLKRYAEEVTTVGDPRISREVILPGRFKRVYVDEGYGRVLIGGKQLSELDLQLVMALVIPKTKFGIQKRY